MKAEEIAKLAEVERCPGCGTVVDQRDRRGGPCYPHDVDTALPGYTYLKGVWGYCRTLGRSVRPAEQKHWIRAVSQ